MQKIKCETKETWRNKKTGRVYHSEDEVKMDLTSDPKDIQKDLTVTISPEGLDVLQKIMNQK